MPSPAEAADDRSVFGDGVEDDVDDSEEEEEEVDDESDEEEEEEEVTAPGKDLNSSSPSTSTSSDRGSKPNPNNNTADPTKQSYPSRIAAAAAIQVSPISAAAPAAAHDDLVTPSPDRKRRKTEPAEAASEEKKPLVLMEDSRRLFQRLWTDEDEIAILEGFLEFTSQRSAGTAHHHDTGPFYDLIKTRLQLEFNKNQLVEKLRRLKKKYRNVMNKMGSGKGYAFKSPHDQATFELSRKIWSNSIYYRTAATPTPVADEEDERNPQINHSNVHGMNSGRRTPRMRRRGRKRLVAEAAVAMLAPEAPVEVKVAESHMPVVMASVPNVLEETVRNCLSPLFKELLYCTVGGPVGPGLGGGSGWLGLSSLLPTIGGNPVILPSSGNVAAVDAKWRKQQILELEVYLKRIELVQEQIKSMLEELRSMG